MTLSGSHCSSGSAAPTSSPSVNRIKPPQSLAHCRNCSSSSCQRRRTKELSALAPYFARATCLAVWTAPEPKVRRGATPGHGHACPSWRLTASSDGPRGRKRVEANVREEGGREQGKRSRRRAQGRGASGGVLQTLSRRGLHTVTASCDLSLVLSRVQPSSTYVASLRLDSSGGVTSPDATQQPSRWAAISSQSPTKATPPP